MKEKTLNFLEAHLSDTPSTFVEGANLRKENETWLRWSRRVALCIVDYMQENSLTRSDVAEKLGVSPQYVSRILSGNTNFSFKSIAEIERKLGISCMESVGTHTSSTYCPCVVRHNRQHLHSLPESGTRVGSPSLEYYVQSSPHSAIPEYENTDETGNPSSSLLHEEGADRLKKINPEL
ncbi:MAG: helix-turn-helix transcriptional regulator [Prevotellaceae bacterium]|nr:helix-turn-helix transcriptional regulator [Prevotellaceae bacterium]